MFKRYGCYNVCTYFQVDEEAERCPGVASQTGGGENEQQANGGERQHANEQIRDDVNEIGAPLAGHDAEQTAHENHGAAPQTCKREHDSDTVEKQLGNRLTESLKSHATKLCCGRLFSAIRGNYSAKLRRPFNARQLGLIVFGRLVINEESNFKVHSLETLNFFT